MLLIRSQQMRVLSAERRHAFESRIEQHLLFFFPERYAALSPEDRASLIRQEVARAINYGFDTERDICKYLNIISVFGRDFQSDQRLPWAAEILHKPFRTSAAKMNRLTSSALAYLSQ